MSRPAVIEKRWAGGVGDENARWRNRIKDTRD